MKYFIGLFILLFSFILPAQNPYNQGNLTGNTSGTKKRTPLNTLERASGQGQTVLTDAQGNLRLCNAVDVNLVPVLTPPSPTGNLTNLGKFVSTPSGDVYFIDYYGESVALGKPSQDSTTASNGLVMVGNDIRLINYNIAPIGSIPIKAINGSLQWGIPIFWKTTGNNVLTEPGGLVGYVGSDSEVALIRGNAKRVICDDNNTIEINDGGISGTNANENQDLYIYSHNNTSNGAGTFINSSYNVSNLVNFFQRADNNRISGNLNILINSQFDTVSTSSNTLISSNNLNVNGTENVYINCKQLPPITSAPTRATFIDRSVEIDNIGESGIVTDRISTVSARVEELPSKPDDPTGHPVGFNASGNLVPIAPTANTDQQTLSINGANLSISNGNTVTLPVQPDTDDQTLALNGNQLTISEGNTVTLPVQPDTDDQTLSINGTELTISDGNTVTLPTGWFTDGNFGTDENWNRCGTNDTMDFNIVSNQQTMIRVKGQERSIQCQDSYVKYEGSFGANESYIFGRGAVGFNQGAVGTDIYVDDSSNGAYSAAFNGATIKNGAYNFAANNSIQDLNSTGLVQSSFSANYATIEDDIDGTYGAFASNSSNVSGSNSFGCNAGTTSGNNAFASGEGISANWNSHSGNQGWALADYAASFNIGKTYGLASFAANNGTARGAFSFAAGRLGITRGLGAIALGHNAEARSLGEIELGLYPTVATGGDSSAFVATDRILNVGIGTDLLNRKDAFTILKNGSAGINNNLPAEKLDVVGKFRLTDRTGTPTKIAGWSATDRSADITIGSGLTLSAAGVLSAGSSAGVSLTDISPSYANSTIDNFNFTKTLNHSTLTNQSAFTLTSSSITSGRILRVDSYSNAYAGEEGLLTVTNATTNTNGITAKIQMGSNATNSFVFRNNGNAGTATLDPRSRLDINGTIGLANSHQTTATVDLSTVPASIIYLEGTSAQSVILPSAATVARREYTIINKTNFQAGLSSSYRNISGTLLSILPARNSLTIVSDGIEWIQTGGSTMVPAEKIQLVTATISTALDPDITYICNNTGNITLTLPQPNQCGNCQVSISRGTATGTITVFPGGGNIQEYDGTMNSQTTIPAHSASGAGFNHTFKSDGASNWYR